MRGTLHPGMGIWGTPRIPDVVSDGARSLNPSGETLILDKGFADPYIPDWVAVRAGTPPPPPLVLPRHSTRTNSVHTVAVSRRDFATSGFGPQGIPDLFGIKRPISATSMSCDTLNHANQVPRYYDFVGVFSVSAVTSKLPTSEMLLMFCFCQQ